MYEVEKNRSSIVLCITAIGLIGCTSPAPPEPDAPSLSSSTAPGQVRVVGLELGARIGSDLRVTEPKSTFGVHDTIYLSVATEGGSSGAKLAARWTYGDERQLVNETSETIAPTGSADTGFHVRNPNPWPLGKYRVEVSLDGNPAGAKEFVVK